MVDNGDTRHSNRVKAFLTVTALLAVLTGYVLWMAGHSAGPAVRDTGVEDIRVPATGGHRRSAETWMRQPQPHPAPLRSSPSRSRPHTAPVDRSSHRDPLPDDIGQQLSFWVGGTTVPTGDPAVCTTGPHTGEDSPGTPATTADESCTSPEP